MPTDSVLGHMTVIPTYQTNIFPDIYIYIFPGQYYNGILIYSRVYWPTIISDSCNKNTYVQYM